MVSLFQRPVELLQLSEALIDEFDRSEDLGILDRSVRAAERLAQFVPVGHELRPLAWDNIARALRRRYVHTNDLTALETAIARAYEAVLTGYDHPLRFRFCNNLGMVVTDRYEATMRELDLRDAEWAYRTAVECAPAGHPGVGTILSGLQSVLLRRYESLNDIALLEEAVRVGRRAVALPQPHPNRRAMAMSELSHVLTIQSETGDRADALAEAVAVARLAAAIPDVPPTDRALYLERLAVARFRQVCDIGDTAAFDEAESCLREAVRIVPAGAVRRPSHLIALANVLSRRHLDTGDPAVLAEATRLTREAAHSVRPTGVDGAGHFINVGTMLMNAFDRDGAVSALEDAAAAFRRAVDGLRTGDPFRASAMSQLSTALMHLAEVNSARATSLITEAVEVGRDAHAAVEDGSRFAPAVFNNLALVLTAAADLLDRPHLLGEAENLYRQVLRRPSVDHVLHANAANNLGSLLSDHHDDPHALAEAEMCFRETMSLAAARGRPVRVTEMNLALVLADRARLEGIDRYRIEARRTLSRVADSEQEPPTLRTRAYTGAARLAAEVQDWPSATAHYTSAIEQFRLASDNRWERSDRRHTISRLGTIPSDAAACALRMGRPDAAIQALALLEDGRARLLAPAIQTRYAISRLRRIAPDLAEQLARITRRLDYGGGTGPTNGLDRLHQWEELSQTRREIIDAVHRIPQMQDFLRPVNVPRLLTQIGKVDVAVVNISRYGCDALLIQAGKIKIVPLRKLTAADAARQAVRLIRATAALQQPDIGWKARHAAAKDVNDILAWLWDVAAGPVVTAAGHLAQPGISDMWPRIWWCPTGLMTFLPLHAAGHHNGSLDATIDRVVSSYTPTVQILADGLGRNALENAVDRPRQVVVSLPDAPATEPLRHAHRELGAVTAHHPMAQVLTGARATRAAILAALRNADRFHFAGHGVQYPAQLARAGLIPYDHTVNGWITPDDIANLNLSEAYLAYLSACETALGDISLADESAHLAGAMQVAGFRHVIAAVWILHDRTAADIARAFYAAEATLGPALALHKAVRETRHRSQNDTGRTGRDFGPLQWAPLVHVGP